MTPAANLVEKIDYHGSEQVLVGNGVGLAISHLEILSFNHLFALLH